MPVGGFSPSTREVIYRFAVAVMSTRSPLAFSRISVKNTKSPPVYLTRKQIDAII